MKKQENLFIFNRPLQYLNIKGILHSLDKNDNNILLVHANFNSGQDFCKHIRKYDDVWSEVLLISSKKDLLKEVVFRKISRLFINSDLGFDQVICWMSFADEVYVYEEGWGTYNQKVKPESLLIKLKSIPYKLIGSGNAMGHSRLTKGIFIYKLDLYNQLFPYYKGEVIKFETSYPERISKERSFFQSLYNYEEEISDLKGMNILIYATGWKISQDVVRDIKNSKSNFDMVLLKLHPHIRDYNSINLESRSLNQNVMLEFYLDQLLEQHNNITVYHDNSFSVFYYLDKVVVKNIGRKKLEYQKIISFFN